MRYCRGQNCESVRASKTPITELLICEAMFRTIVISAVLISTFPSAAAVRKLREQSQFGGMMQSEVSIMGGEHWWPFSSADEQAQKSEAPKVAAPARPRLADAKDQVMLSEAFGRKTAALCRDASEQDRIRCRALAGHRLFCALMRRHQKQYMAMDGVEEEKAKCLRVNIMDEPVEAARDEREEDDAKGN